MQDDYLKYIGTIGESLRGFSKWTEIYEQQINAIQLATSLQPVLDATARYRNVIDSLIIILQIVRRGLRLKSIFTIAEQRYKWQDFVLSVQLE